MRWGQLRNKFADILFPPRCIGCGRIGWFLCANCCQKLPKISPPLCEKCGRPESSGVLCPSCWNWQTKIDGIRSPFHFDGIMRQAIHELKYRNLKSISSCLADLLFNYLEDSPLPGDVLVSVPLHAKRLRQRGYNQTGLIAMELSRLTSIPAVEGCLIRLQNNSPQTRTATVEERRRNVVNAFCCRDERFTGKHVLLIDDVCTSGATLDACAEALKAGGAVTVWGLTLARET